MKSKRFGILNNEGGHKRLRLCKLHKHAIAVLSAAAMLFTVAAFPSDNAFDLGAEITVGAVDSTNSTDVTTTNQFEGSIDLTSEFTNTNGVSYDSEAKVLTLDNVTVSNNTGNSSLRAIEFEGDMTIAIKGTCKIEGFYAIYSENVDVTIKSADNGGDMLYVSDCDCLVATTNNLTLLGVNLRSTTNNGFIADNVITVESCNMEINVIAEGSAFSALYANGGISITNSRVEASMKKYDNGILVPFEYPAIAAVGIGKESTFCTIKDSNLSLSSASSGINVGCYFNNGYIHGSTTITGSIINFDCKSGIKAYLGGPNDYRLKIDQNSFLMSKDQSIFMIEDPIMNNKVLINEGATIQGIISSAPGRIEICSDMTWTEDYTIPDNTALVVRSGAVLTLQNGAKIIKGTGSTISNQGTIKAGCNTTLTVDIGNPANIADHVYDSGVCTACGSYEDGIGAQLAGYSLSLGGNIGVNFYMGLDESVIADKDAYMQFTLPNGDTPQVKVSDAKTDMVNGKTYHVFSCEVAAKEMADDITAQIVLGNGTKGTVYTYSVREYASYIIQDINMDREPIRKAFVAYMLFYGNYAKAYFSGSTIKENEGMKNVTAENVSAYKKVETGTLPAGITYYGSSLLLESETTLRHYFKVAKGTDVSGYNFTGNKGDCYYIDIANISASNLDTAQEVSIGDYKISYSPMSYVYSVLSNDNASESLKNLCKSLYLYGDAANKYVSAYS